VDKDRLDQVFDMQRGLQKRIGTPESVVSGASLKQAQFKHADAEFEVLTWHKEFTLSLMMEAAELMDWMPWKHWSKQLGNKEFVEPYGATHVSEVHLEIVDCLHFLVNLSLLWGLTPQRMFEIYQEKNAINAARQESGKY